MKVEDCKVGMRIKATRKDSGRMSYGDEGTIFEIGVDSWGRSESRIKVETPKGPNGFLYCNPADFEPVEPEYKFGDKIELKDGRTAYYLGASGQSAFYHCNSPVGQMLYCEIDDSLLSNIKEPEPENTTVELTLSEIADKIGINVKDLKIVDKGEINEKINN